MSKYSNIIEIKIIIENNDGLANALDSQALKIEDIQDVILAEKLETIMELLKDANTYINEKIEELKDNYDDYCEDYCD